MAKLLNIKELIEFLKTPAGKKYKDDVRTGNATFELTPKKVEYSRTHAITKSEKIEKFIINLIKFILTTSVWFGVPFWLNDKFINHDDAVIASLVWFIGGFVFIIFNNL
jgi:hypothetical protein